ncbi:MAG: hypothetical protein V2A78_11955 [bacterium]
MVDKRLSLKEFLFFEKKYFKKRRNSREPDAEEIRREIVSKPDRLRQERKR